VLAVLLISGSPGPAMALILRRAAVQGWRGAVPPVLGLEVGLYVWALLQVVIETALYLGLAAVVGRAGGWLRRPRVRRRVEAVTGTVMIGLGARVALSSR